MWVVRYLWRAQQVGDSDSQPPGKLGFQHKKKTFDFQQHHSESHESVHG